VIHYDRWWNAAREDQATDRVHRFGQTRGVEVFKLITKDSIEERIDSIIHRKRILSNDILTEDSPEEMKKFNREDLIEILTGFIKKS
jgi:SNF2 family DNA or RNA helicase